MDSLEDQSYERAVQTMQTLKSTKNRTNPMTISLKEALEPFARIVGPLHEDDPDGRTLLEAIEGPNGTGELKLSTYVGDGTRFEILYADDFRRAKAAYDSLSEPATGKLVERLRGQAEYEDNGGCVERQMEPVGTLLRKAADTIEALSTPMSEALDTLTKLRADLAEEDAELHAQRIAVIDQTIQSQPAGESSLGTALEKTAATETYAEWQQNRGALADGVDAAIAAYDDYMRDDRYDAQQVLDDIIAKLRERRSWSGTYPNPREERIREILRNLLSYKLASMNTPGEPFRQGFPEAVAAAKSLLAELEEG